MKARLDHVGIAVSDIAAALAFYRDALGLEVDATEDVASQRVRAHFIQAGDAALELLEGTAADSPITRYLGKRGPGLHHITLQVEDIDAALAHLHARGVRLIDREPRPGAEGARVAFIHPAAAHGVLVELKEGRDGPPPAGATRPAFPHSRAQRIQRFSLGDLELTSLYDGYIRLDGGAMFGVVPRTLWAEQTLTDDRNRIVLAMRPLLVRGSTQTVLVDAGLGDKESGRFLDLYGVDRARHLDHALAEAGVAADEIDLVIATHLHFDHAGGFTRREPSGRLVPRFPRARYIVRRGEWDDATHPHARNRASYRPDNFAPLADNGCLSLIDDDQGVIPGIRVERTPGHTAHHQSVWLESGGAHAVFMGDLLPTVAHLPDAWIMGYDLHPVDTLQSKGRFLAAADRLDPLLFFEHDPQLAAGRLRTKDGRRTVEPVPAAD